ncbi:hypothetical protein F4604DRAFT_1696544, partial [Suillus subluteus]
MPVVLLVCKHMSQCLLFSLLVLASGGWSRLWGFHIRRFANNDEPERRIIFYLHHGVNAVLTAHRFAQPGVLYILYKFEAREH